MLHMYDIDVAEKSPASSVKKLIASLRLDTEGPLRGDCFRVERMLRIVGTFETGNVPAKIVEGLTIRT